MSKIIYKYPLPLLNNIMEIEVHRYAKALHVGIDPIGDSCIWFELDSEQPKEKRTLLAIGTGINFEAEFKQETMKYIGTFIRGLLVQHIYQIGGSS